MSRRRYRMADHPSYHKAFDAEKGFSIKNPAMDRSHLADRAGCESLRREILEKIQERSSRVSDIEQEFKQHKERCQNEGRAIPETMDAVTLDKWLEAAARLDVAMEESDLVEERLKIFAEAEQKERQRACLQYGPIGSGRLIDGVLAEIDFQRVGMGDDGILRIMDPNSPYDGMAIGDYKEFLVKPFHRARAQQQRMQMESLLQQQREHPELALPANPPAIRMGKIDKHNLPPWPPEVKRPEAVK